MKDEPPFAVSGSMVTPPNGKSPEEIQADMLDVHILDLLAQVELLRRHVHNMQQSALRLREVTNVASPRSEAVAEVRRRLSEMQTRSSALHDALASVAELVGEMSSKRSAP